MRFAPLLLLVLLAPFASAHAALRASDPAPGASLAPGDITVSLRFSEGLDAAWTACWLDGPSGALRLDAAPRVDDPRVLEARAALAPGAYVLRWRALGLDGHATSGEVPFAVGAAQAPVPVPLPLPVPSLSEAAWRAILVGGLLLAAGCAAGLGIVGADAAARRRGARLCAFAALAAGVAAVALVGVLARALGVAWADAARTVAGEALLLQAALAFAAGAIALVRARLAERTLGPVIGVAGAALVAHAGGSHAAHAGVLLDAAHLVAAAIWVGGVAALLLSPRDLGTAAKRFAPWAVASVALLALTGAAQAMTTLGGLAPVVSTSYGRLVALKAALLLVALGLAGRHALGQATGGALRRRIAAESVALGALVAAAGLLASTPTP